VLRLAIALVTGFEFRQGTGKFSAPPLCPELQRHYPQLPTTKRPQLECDSFDAAMLERKFFFCRNPTTNTPFVALFTYFMRNYIFVALDILPRRRKKQGCSRRWRWHPFTKLCSVTLQARTVSEISLYLCIILLTSCGNDDC